MRTLAGKIDLDAEHAVSVIEHVSNDSKPFAPGNLQIVRLLQRLRRPAKRASQWPAELMFAAKPGSRNSSVRRVHLVFMDETETTLPAPELADELATIRLFYPIAELQRITALLAGRTAHFCYFWRSADASRIRAWLFTPH